MRAGPLTRPGRDACALGGIPFRGTAGSAAYRTVAPDGGVTHALSVRTLRPLRWASRVRSRTSSLQPHPAAEDVDAHGAVAVGADDGRHRAPERGHGARCRVAVGVVPADLDGG